MHDTNDMNAVMFEISRAYRRARRASLYAVGPTASPERAARFESPTALSTMLI